MKSRIAIDGTSALSQRGGIGRFTRGLIMALARCDQENRYQIGYTKDVAAQPRFELPANFRWQELGLTQKQATWVWHWLRLPLPVERWLEQPALFHSPDYTLPPLSRARGIVTVHDLSFEALPHVHVPKLRRYLRRAVPHSIARADHIFADSESTRQEILRYYGSDPTKITVVYPGVEPHFRPLDPSDPVEARCLEGVRERYGLDRPFLLSVGTLEPRKNVQALIRAYALYWKESGSDHLLVIAGGGGWLGQRERLESLVRELGLEGRVRFTGFVPDELLPALLNLAEALVYPSLYEGFGIPVLEGLACGVPVITARNTSLPEAGGQAARYVDDPNDAPALAAAIQAVIEDGAERERMIQAGLAHAANFTWERTARQVLTLYKQLLDG